MTGNKKFILSTIIGASMAQLAWGQGTEMAAVVSMPVSRTITLPGEIQPFLNVALRARVAGYVDRVLVDRGSAVKEGDLVIELSAPEMKAQIAEAQSKVQVAEGDRLQAEAKLASLQSTLASLEATLRSAQATYDSLKVASQTPGAISGNELEIALRAVEAQRAGVEAQRGSIQAQRASLEAIRNGKAAAEAALRAIKELEVMNPDQSLIPGMYATVKWPVRRTQPALYVPRTSVVTTTERTFVIREKNGKAEWVNLSRGPADGDLVEVIGPLQAGDKVVKRANDELREGTPLR